MRWSRAALVALTIGLGAQLLSGPVRQGWSQMGTDFPNHYTAALLARRGEPLRQYYDWTWFQRQIHYAGIERQLGGYVPHTPLTMLPLLPLTWLPPQNAKRAWIACELLFLLASIALLSRLSGISWLRILVLALLAHAALANNFLIGQYYIFVLLLLTGGVLCLLRGREALGGALLGLIFTLKLYTAPFLLFFAVRRQWRAALGFAGAVFGLTILAMAIFGPHAVWYFATTVMLRGLDGSVNDPYNPGWASMTAFLRHTLLAEPELNPHPLAQAPAAFYFLRAFYTVGVLAAALLVLSRRSQQPAHAVAWFTIILFVLSPNTASYHYILLLVPIALLLPGASWRWGAGLIFLYVLVELRLYSWDARYFPKAWLLLALAIYAGWRCWSRLPRRTLFATTAAVAAIAAADAAYRMRQFYLEPPQVDQRVAVTPGSNFSSLPASTMTGLVFESIGRDRYILRTASNSGTRDFSFDGDAFFPAPTRSGDEIYFELVSAGRSRILRLHPATGDSAVVVGPEWNPTEPAISPDGGSLAFVSGRSLYLMKGGSHWRLATGMISRPQFFPDGARLAFAEGLPGHRRIAVVSASGGPVTTLQQGDCTDPAVSPDGTKLAFACQQTGAEHLWVRDLSSGRLRRMTDGACDNSAPAWTPDSRSLIFASDCRRGLGLTSLFQVAVN